MPRWLSGSKYRQPLWHGSNRSGLRELRPNVSGRGDEGEYGIYLMTKSQNADVFGPRVYKVYANIRKPLFVKDMGAGKLEWMEETFGHFILNAKDVQALKKKGFDSIVVTKSPGNIGQAHEVVVFDSEDVFVAAEY